MPPPPPLRAAILLLVALCVLARGDEMPRPRVTLPQGTLEGFHTVTRKGRSIEAYTAIPFAVPPLGALRFKAPLAAGAWSGVLDASADSPQCVQRNPYIRQQGITGQEDCLYLNVYTPAPAPERNNSSLLPVMVWFHGGGLMCGTGAKHAYGPEYILDRDVVYVATNYRLGPLGFLSTQDAECPGNNGLKDQQEALRWVRANIHKFGGDSSSVTIFGESAGGASVHLHMLSPSSAGLFHKAISQSGTALVPWAYAAPGEAARRARRLAELLACPFTPSDRLLACLRTKHAADIIDTEFSFYSWDYEPMTPFKPVVEPDLPGAFLTRDPLGAPLPPSVPWMTGLTQDEGCLKTTWLLANETLLKEFSDGFERIAPVTFYYEESPERSAATARLLQRYFGGKRPGQIHRGDKQALIDVYTDSYFAHGLLVALRAHLPHSQHPTYLYSITHRAANSFSQIFGDPHGDHGVCHADDLIYLFPHGFLSKPHSERDEQMIEIFLNLWTNFATSGNPNEPLRVSESAEEWSPVTSVEEMEHLNIGAELAMSRGLALRALLWDELALTPRARSLNDDDGGVRDEL